MANRFDYVLYDSISAEKGKKFKEMFMELENQVTQDIKPGRAQSLIYTKLEEAYMWVGKAIRDEQQSDRGAYQLQEARTNS